ncbi:MAG: glycosyltransferase family 4 protein [Gammaproteobacteria bacterium]|nr:glycosyltransferase family 4 protein [Gammaproteobacteria bacterium]
MKKLLVIGYVWPEPNSSAAGSHMLSLIQLFKEQGWQVTFASPAVKSGFEFDLESIGILVESIKLNCDSFNQFCHSLRPDAVLFDRFMMEEQFGWRVELSCPDAVRILDTEDLQCLRDARHRLVKSSSDEINKLEPNAETDSLNNITVKNNTVKKITVKNVTFTKSDILNPKIKHLSDIALREIAAIFRSDLSLIISSFEFDWLKTNFSIPEQQLLHIPFLVNQAEKEFTHFKNRKNFISIGNFRHAPNWDSVLQLKSLWPSIRHQLPEAELHIYGAYTPPKATALNDSKGGFIIKDRAESALNVIRHARVLLAPLRFGAGIKGKLMDAMMVGTPSVTTPIGAEGMQVSEHWPGAVVDNSAEFVQRAVELYQDEQLWTRSQNKIVDTLSTNFDYQSIASRLIQRIDAVVENPSDHRAHLFFNAMFRYHSMRSTEFMSRWIDLKNKLQAEE